MATTIAKIKRQQLFCVFDSLLSIFIFAPLVVAFWRGLWQLLEHYLFKGNLEASAWTSVILGIGLGVLFDVFQDKIKNKICSQKTPKLYILLSRVYIVIYGFVSVNHWRGIWTGWDVYTGTSWQSAVISTILGLFLLSILRGIRNLIAPPFTVVPDHLDFFTISNIYGTNKSDGKHFYIDVLTSVVVIASLVVFVWRGMWVFLDRLLFPDNELYSGCGSGVIGLFVTGVIFITHPIIQRMAIFKSKGTWKIIAEDVYFTLCLIGCLNIWRAVWFLLNVLLYPDRRFLSNWISTLIGMALLLIMQNGNTILVRGTLLDGKKEGAEAITLSTEYLRFFFKESEASVPDKENVFSKIDKMEDSLKSNGLPDGRGYYHSEPV